MGSQKKVGRQLGSFAQGKHEQLVSLLPQAVFVWFCFGNTHRVLRLFLADLWGTLWDERD